jgi:di- and tripeptidase
MMDEALKDLVMLLATLGGTNGKVNIPGFYEKVLPITEAENRRYDAISQSLLRQNPDIASSATAHDLTASFMAKWREPSFTIHGFETSGPANSTVIPHVANASVSFRIVPDQEAEQIQEDFVRFLQDQFAKLNTLNTLAITIDHQADPWLGDTENLIFKMLERAIMEVWGPLGRIRRGSTTKRKSVVEGLINGHASPKIAPVTSSTLTNGSNVSPQTPTNDFSWARTELPSAVLSRDSQKPLYIREGGSIPAIRFLEKEFNAPAAHLPCGQASDNAHLDNERFRLLNLYNSREIFKKVFSESWS